METLERTREYPCSIKGKGGVALQLHRLGPQDKDRVLEFARGLKEEDLLFLRMDLTRPKVVEQLIHEQQLDRRVTLLAEDGGTLVGYASLHRLDLDWMRHLGEIRVIIAGQARGQGLGTLLAKELFAIAHGMGLTKLVAQMVRQQQDARRMFQKLGFSAEALLADWVIDREGKTRDLVVMSHDVTALTH